MLSLFLQSDSSTVVTAMAHIEACSDKLIAKKERKGQHLAKFIDSFKATGAFMGISVKQNATDEATFQSLHAQFFYSTKRQYLSAFPINCLTESSRCA